MSRKRSYEEITPAPTDAPKNGLEHKELVQALKKMIHRIEDNQVDLSTLLTLPLALGDEGSNLKQSETITEKDVQKMLDDLRLLIGDVIDKGEVTVDDSDPDIRVFKMKIIYPLSVTDKDLNSISKIPGVATIELEQTTVNEMNLSLTYTKNRKLYLFHRQQQVDATVASNSAADTTLTKKQPGKQAQNANLSTELLTLIEDNFDADLDDDVDLQIQTKCSKDDVIDVVFSVSIKGVVRYEKVAAVAAHQMINYLRVYPGSNRNMLRLEIATFKVRSKENKSKV